MGLFTAKPKPPPRVTMFTRHGCHLCDEAWQLLLQMQRKFPMELEALDIDTSAEWVQRHGDRVPVIVVNGKERCWGRINRVLLERALRGNA